MINDTLENDNQITQQPEYNDSVFREHSQFQQNYAELHARPFPVLSAPAKVSNLAFFHSNAMTHRHEIEHLSILCQLFNVVPPLPDDTCFYQDFGEFELRWERHTEFSSYSFLVYGDNEKPFTQPPLNFIDRSWLKNIAGEVIAAVHIELRSHDEITADREYLRKFFEQKRLIGSALHHGEATIWSALCLHNDNFNRILVINKSLNNCQCGRVVRALLEVEVYRNMALLAFPLAQKISVKVNNMEAQLAQLLKKNDVNRSSDDERTQLIALSQMTATIAELINRSRYRFDASHAYYQMVQSRLSELEERELNELQTMAAFIDRRLSPAHRTAQATKYRLDDLAARVDRASDFLRTRVDLAIESQNQALLHSMNKRAQMQLNLQQTVEGLSVVVISYCILSLLRYLLVAADYFTHQIAIDAITAFLMPIVLLVVWVLSRRFRKRLRQSETDD